MFYEGSEKKLEVVVGENCQDLRRLTTGFWEKVVEQANAVIVSKIKTAACDAYVLSESSLFVWQKKFVMLTCGETTLADALVLFAEQIGREKMSFITYQRGREIRPKLQVSHFLDDVIKLANIMPGDAYKIGNNEHDGHYLFHSRQPYDAEPTDCTSELLMYKIRGDIADYLRSAEQNIIVIRQMLNLEQLLPEFTFDDFLFSPLGYSVNGLFEDKYFTLHVTPQEHSSYVGCETNINLSQYHTNIFARILALFQPEIWDTIGFNSKIEPQYSVNDCSASCCAVSIEQGYDIDFQFYRPGAQTLLKADLL